MLWSSVGLLAILSVTSVDLAAPGNRSHAWELTWTDKLRHDLLTNYDKSARPAQFSGYVNVNFTLSVSHVFVDEPKSMMVIKAWSYIEWEDDKLRWNASDYGGLTKITVADHEIWHPDVILLTSAIGDHKEYYFNTICTIYSNGSVHRAPPSQFSTYCELDLRKWPYDKQKCQYFFSSWMEEGGHIVLVKRDRTSLEDHGILEPCEWGLESVKERLLYNLFPCCTEDSSIIGVTVRVYRLTYGYGTVVFAPAVVCVMLTLAIFWLPPLSTEKFLIPSVNIVITTVLLVYFSHLVPITAEHTPFIVIFYAYNLVLVCISVMVSVSLGRRRAARPVKSAVNRLLSSPVSSYLRLDDIRDSFTSMYSQQECKDLQDDSPENVESSIHQKISSNIHERILLITVIDRVMFCLYLIIFILLGLFFYSM